CEECQKFGYINSMSLRATHLFFVAKQSHIKFSQSYLRLLRRTKVLLAMTNQVKTKDSQYLRVFCFTYYSLLIAHYFIHPSLILSSLPQFGVNGQLRGRVR